MLATVGNGRSPREGGNVIFRRGSMRGAEAALADCEVSASGEDTVGRETVIVAVNRVNSLDGKEVTGHTHRFTLQVWRGEKWGESCGVCG